MNLDVKDFYLGTTLPTKEYIRIPAAIIPQEILSAYNLQDLIHDGYLYAEVSKGMYGLPQAGIIANDELLPRLAAGGYKEAGTTPGLFKHETNSIVFCLIVDDFGVKYVGREHAEHLYKVLCNHYQVTTDWAGERYIGIHLRWDYDARIVHLFMPGYVQKSLTIFWHRTRCRQNQPHPHTPVQYGATKQYAKTSSTAPLLDSHGKKFIQQVCGKIVVLRQSC